MGFYSTATDLIKVLKEIQTGGRTTMSRESVTEMLKSQLNKQT